MMNIILKQALACYLISLFYKSGCKYYCSRPKINRLLTIYKFCSIPFDPDCFYSFFRTDASRMLISELTFFIDRDVYFLYDLDADNREEFIYEFDESVSIPSRFHVDESLLSSDSKILLEVIFRRFGSYSIRNLAPSIDEMHKNIPFRKKIIMNLVYVIVWILMNF